MTHTEFLIILHLKGNGWVYAPTLVSRVFNDMSNHVSRDVIHYTARDLFHRDLILSKVIDRKRHYHYKELK